MYASIISMGITAYWGQMLATTIIGLNVLIIHRALNTKPKVDLKRTMKEASKIANNKRDKD